jgi:hypothetical protein
MLTLGVRLLDRAARVHADHPQRVHHRPGAPDTIPPVSGYRRFTPRASAGLRQQRDAIEQLRSTLEAMSANGAIGERDGDEAFAIGLHVGRAVEQLAHGVGTTLRAYSRVIGDSWAEQLQAALALLSAMPSDDPADLIDDYASALREIEALLGELDIELRVQAMEGLGTGEVVSDADLAALLSGQPPAA